MKTSLININGDLIDVRFISEISRVYIHKNILRFDIQSSGEIISNIRRTIGEDYDLELTYTPKLYINTEFNGTLSDFLKKYSPLLESKDEYAIKTEFPITYKKVSAVRDEILKIRAIVLEQDDSSYNLDMKGFL